MDISLPKYATLQFLPIASTPDVPAQDDTISNLSIKLYVSVLFVFLKNL